MKLFLFFLIFICLDINAQNLQKPKTYTSFKEKYSFWLMSEKLDGIRAYWNGKELISKNGNKIHAPTWFTKDLPSFELDGELWTKRADFENIQNIVLDKMPSSSWNQISYNIFEIPNTKGDFYKRLEKLKNWKKKHYIKHLRIIKQIEVKSEKNMNKYLNKLLKINAEGIILKNPKLKYFSGRSNNILKVKKFYDDEALVIGINYKKDKSFKSLKVKLKNNVVFNLGNGFGRGKILPNVGDIITFKYYGFTKNKKPKFASFLRIRNKE